MANANPYRFSTKYEDESGLVYYGFRYYSPELGRWVNRDPLGEVGGLLMYGFILNAPLTKIDKLGLWTEPERDPKNSRARTTVEDGDDIFSLARMVGLNPGEADSWFRTVNGKKVNPEWIKPGCVFTVPNVVLISIGNAEDRYWTPIRIPIIKQANDFAKNFRGEALFGNKAKKYGFGVGYKIIWAYGQTKEEDSENTYISNASLGLINKGLSLPDIAIWGHFGHGQNGGLSLGEGDAAQIFYSGSFKPRHSLALILLYSCRAARGGYGWYRHISVNGKLHASFYMVSPHKSTVSDDPNTRADWLYWDDLPFIENPYFDVP